MRAVLGAAHVVIGGGMEVLALGRELPHQFAQLLDTALGSADGQAFFALRIRAWLTRIQPVLDRASEQAVGDVPDVGLLIGICNPVAQIHRLAEGVAERVIGFLHGYGSKGEWGDIVRVGTACLEEFGRALKSPDIAGLLS